MLGCVGRLPTSPIVIAFRPLVVGRYASTQAPTAPAQTPRTTTQTPAASTLPSFDDYALAFSGQSTGQLLRALGIFLFCASPLSQHSEVLLKTSKALIGDRATFFLVKHTFFKHFSAGEDQPEVLKTMNRLRRAGIGGILDYAAEDDVPSTSSSSASSQPATDAAPAVPAHAAPPAVRNLPLHGRAVARQYCYKSELQCDKHVEIFKSAIHTAASMPMQGFAAVKMTGLGNPMLLQSTTDAIREVRGLFQRFDVDGSGFIDRGEFERMYKALLPDANDEELLRVFKWFDFQGSGQVDYVAWCQRLSLSRLPRMAVRIQQIASPDPLDQGGGPQNKNWRSALSDVALSEEEVDLIKGMRKRLQTLAKQAAEQKVKLMVDAEHTYYQPAIDHLTLELQRTYNQGSSAVIYNTYQAYLKDAMPRLKDDLERAKREGYVLGVKLVRGAYLDLERRRAKKMGYPSPVHDTVEETHETYAACMRLLLEQVAAGRAEVLLGTHNQLSVEQAVHMMADLKLDPSKSPVFFGQLLGMSDHLTSVLGKSGYRSFKYVPYGQVQQVVPYLLRRAAENASIMKGTKRDVQLLKAELKRRVLGR